MTLFCIAVCLLSRNLKAAISLHSNCFCVIFNQFQVVKSTVCLLHSVLKIHKQDKLTCQHTVTSPGKEHSICEWGTSQQEGMNTPQNILQTGLHLLHLMLQHSAGFLDRHLAVQHKYVELICSLSHIFRSMENNENECKY